MIRSGVKWQQVCVPGGLFVPCVKGADGGSPSSQQGGFCPPRTVWGPTDTPQASWAQDLWPHGHCWAVVFSQVENNLLFKSDSFYSKLGLHMPGSASWWVTGGTGLWCMRCWVVNLRGQCGTVLQMCETKQMCGETHISCGRLEGSEG